MKKRALAILLAAMLVCVMIPAASAADQAAEVIEICSYAGQEEAYHYSEGFALARVGWDYVFFDKTGKEVLGPYDRAESFHEGLAAVAIGKYPNNMWGFINQKGETVIPFEYDDASSFSEGLAVVGKDVEEVSPTGMTYKTLGHGVIDKTGKIVVPFGKYKYIKSFSEGLATVCNSQYKYGVIDKNGQEIVPCKYASLEEFHDGWAVANNCGYVSKNGEEMLFGKYDWVTGFHDGMAAVAVEVEKKGQQEDDYNHYKWGFIDTTGREVIPCQYADGVPQFSEGLAFVYVDDEKGQFIDKAGNVVIPGPYVYGMEFHEGLLMCDKEAIEV